MQDKEFLRLLANEIVKKRLKTNLEIIKLRNKLCKKYKPKIYPGFIQIFLAANPKQRRFLNKILQTKPSRILSGISAIAVMTKPIACKHGSCIYCPGGPEFEVPKSYTGHEPAVLRAIRNKFNPYLQIFNRLEQYILLGQLPIKTELIIMGGTFPSFNLKYQNNFITDCFRAMNDFSDLFFNKNGFDFDKFVEFFELDYENKMNKQDIIQNKILNLYKKSDLKKEQLKNENSAIRNIALCIETRPDFCKEVHINRMLEQGCTRIELGVQSIYNEILEKINRKHSVEDTIKATQLLKDSFLKVNYHLMPGLLGSDLTKDTEMFKEIFEKQDFKPDSLKIYPCMVIKGTKLYDLWKQGKFKPLTTEDAVGLITKIKSFVPEYCRIMRIQRDIPTKATIAGVDRTNLRQYINKRLEEEKIKCRCIRCREISRQKEVNGKVKLKRIDYKASNGQEIFLSYETDNALIGFLRLRIPYKPFRKEITNNSAGIRELHVYGPSTELGKKGIYQHRGYGKALLENAERIASEEFDIKKLLVISGIGVKEYYKKFCYKKDGIYMSKILK